MNTIDRIKAIQARLGLEADGVVGPATLTAVERLMDDISAPLEEQPRLTCSSAGLEWIVKFEISSETYYNRHLKHPTWRGGDSGITIGVGYDLGFVTIAQMRRDWGGKIADADLGKLEKVCGLKAEKAQSKVKLVSIRAVAVPLESASKVFHTSSLPAFAKKCLKAYPGIEKLPADAQAALLSLVFDRGAQKSGSTRREMKAIEELIVAGDLDGIADQILSMKRLWQDRGLDGLLRRREVEADLVRDSEHDYDAAELVRI
jgi:hypothetical protein